MFFTDPLTFTLFRFYEIFEFPMYPHFTVYCSSGSFFIDVAGIEYAKTLKIDNGKNAILVKFSEKECAPGHVHPPTPPRYSLSTEVLSPNF